MNRRSFLATAAAPALLQAQSEEGLRPIFDGKTLNGWKIEEGPETAFYVNDGAIVIHDSAGFPTWLRTAKQYENFDLRGEFFIKGWSNSGIYIHAPEHGRPTWVGIKLNLFQDRDEPPKPESMGSIFPLIAPKKINVKSKGEWNTFRILMDWPSLKVWTNDELIQDVDIESVPELRHRFRSGYIGIESLSYPLRFRNFRLRELPSKQKWDVLYREPADLAKWKVTEGEPKLQALGRVLYADGLGHFGTREKYRDFELQMYVRHAWHHNGGILFRGEGAGNKGKHYEIQLHDVEGAHYPTGSLYHLKRASYPRIQAGEWFPIQVVVKGKDCLVRVNGDTVMEYDSLDNLNEGPIELQAHDRGKFTEYKEILIRRL